MASGSRTSYVGTESIGDVVTKVNLDKGPGGLTNYATITANTSAFSAGLNSVSGLSAGTTPATAGRMFMITAGGAGFNPSGSGTVTGDFVIYDNTATAGLASNIVCNAAVAAFNCPGTRVVAVDSNVAHNYIVAINVVNNTGTNTVQMFATAAGSAARTAYILVQDIGPQF